MPAVYLSHARRMHKPEEAATMPDAFSDFLAAPSGDSFLRLPASAIRVRGIIQTLR
jgi:hypothetical protein